MPYRLCEGICDSLNEAQIKTSIVRLKVHKVCGIGLSLLIRNKFAVHWVLWVSIACSHITFTVFSLRGITHKALDTFLLP